jgi:hypothetical protein
MSVVLRWRMVFARHTWDRQEQGGAPVGDVGEREKR